MDSINEKIDRLSSEIARVSSQQAGLNQQLVHLMSELEELKNQVAGGDKKIKDVPVKVTEIAEVITAPIIQVVPQSETAIKSKPKEVTVNPDRSFEEFIGMNIASKVGILITITGIFIGAKYAIDHDLISPSVRIILGYLAGLILAGVALRLKKKFSSYSSVLMGGGLAVLYFITFVAYSFYGMMPLLVAFLLMLLFTAATVYASVLYNMSIIAQLGLIGAYGIPFLLSDNSGRYAVFFSYIAIINCGILVLSFRKYWKSLFYSAFILTWIIYIAWFVFQYKTEHFTIAILFLNIYFFTFYITFLSYKLIRKEQYSLSDVIVLLSNAFLYYGAGYAILSEQYPSTNFSGVFTVFNAVIHTVISQLIRKRVVADKSLYYLLIGLGIVFLTIAVPVQFDGNWVTLLWTAEAVLVFTIARKRKAATYERPGMVLLVMGVASLAQDWIFSPDTGVTPFFNIIFATGLLVCISQVIILYMHLHKYPVSFENKHSFSTRFYDFILPVLLLISGYFLFFVEIQRYFLGLYETLNINNEQEYLLMGDIERFGLTSMFIYSVIYTCTLYFVNRKWLGSKILNLVCFAFMILLMLVLIMTVLPILNELSNDYFNRPTYFGGLTLAIRYLVFASIAVLLYAGYQSVRKISIDQNLTRGYALAIHAVVLTIISFEYLNWFSEGSQYKLGLSIIWGLYALTLIVYGIGKKLKYLRLAAIALFMITLLKLFVYDLAGAGTITKTISFVSLGVILLLVSYLYNRYKDKI
jgi:uncharacterized membrane protein